MNQMLEMLDHPERKMKTVHIAGTNGKGSTLTYMKQALIQNGYKVGSYTSPSIDRIHDHFHINDQAISDSELIHCMNKLEPIIKRLDDAWDPPTEYEIIFMIAIVYFVCRVDIALVETNMGGTDDSTNCISPNLCIITNIGIDHASFLGNSYAEIANHKAGIIKQGIPVISGVVQPEADAIISAKAYRERADLFQYDKDFFVENHESITDHLESFTFRSKITTLANIQLKMKGKHQSFNASLALMALEKLQEQGFKLEEHPIRAAFQTATIPGRFEQVNDCPIVIVDGAHNQEGICSFLHTVDRYYANERKVLVFAAFKDKPIQSMLENVTNHFESVILTSFNHSRAANMEELRLYVDVERNIRIAEWREEISAIVNEAKNRKEILFFTGSLHFIGLIRKYFENY